jgi:hypothetical protein
MLDKCSLSVRAQGRSSPEVTIKMGIDPLIPLHHAIETCSESEFLEF